MRDRLFTQVFALIVTATCCAVLTLAVARPVEPSQLPPLMLDERAAQAAILQDRVVAQKPLEHPRAKELHELLVAEGKAELPGASGAPSTAGRRRRLTAYAAEVAARHGPNGLPILRARATEAAMALLREPKRALKDEERYLLGAFPMLMERYGLIDAETKRLKAHELCVRTAYKARWNMIHERPLTEGFTPVELEAHHGWIALHASALSMQARADAAGHFYRAGGKRAGEAYAIFLFQGGVLDDAQKLFERVRAQRDELRVRNMALYAHLAARE